MDRLSQKNNLVDAAVGAAVVYRRRELGMTQKAIAELIGVSYQQLQKYESGANRISASKLAKIAEILQVRPDYFFEAAAMHSTDSDFDERLIQFVKSKEGVTFNRAFQAIRSSETRVALLKLIKKLAES